MQIVEALADSNVLDADGNAVYTLRACRQAGFANVRYVLYDAEAGRGLRDGAVNPITSLDRVVPGYNREPLDGHRLILPFIGRLGDAVVTGSCLAALVDRFPGISVDIAAPAPALAVFEMMPRVGRLLPYPIEADALEAYDFHLSFEDVDAVPRGTSRSCADVFSACLRTPKPTSPPSVTIPPDVAARWALPQTDPGAPGLANRQSRLASQQSQLAGRPRVALHVGRANNPRTYPADLMEALAKRLVADGFDIVLIGTGDVASRPADLSIPQVENLIGSTKTPADLGAVLAQMSALVTGDSFPMHLAGAMGVPTLALFTATDRMLGSDYPSVTAIQSAAECSPCKIAAGPCPLGHSECIAHRDASISPAEITQRIVTLLLAQTSA